MRKNFGQKGTVITPLPVLIIGTYDKDGKPNAMNVAWGGQCSEHHVALNLGHKRKTVENLKVNAEFTVSFATRKTLVAADYVGIVSGLKDEDKIEKAGWHAVKASEVNAPVFEELPLALECRLVRMEETPEDELRVVGEVVNMSADESILNEKGKVDLGKLELIMYDSAALAYRVIGEKVGNAFHDGAQLK
ncbi:MAG: flavin reductase family protein [Prevotella sp.]|nr:flavin reductase family protein [Prevotella sp.]